MTAAAIAAGGLKVKLMDMESVVVHKVKGNTQVRGIMVLKRVVHTHGQVATSTLESGTAENGTVSEKSWKEGEDNVIVFTICTLDALSSWVWHSLWHHCITELR